MCATCLVGCPYDTFSFCQAVDLLVSGVFYLTEVLVDVDVDENLKHKDV